MSWTEGAVPLVRTEVLRKAGGCPTGTEDTTATLVARLDSGPGQAKSIQDLPPGPGSYCYAVVAIGPLGRPGVVGTATINYAGRPAGELHRGLGRRAEHAAAADGHVDRPRRADRRLERGTSATAPRSTVRNPPLKSWARAGVYTVTLTVTDNSGPGHVLARTVTIQGGSNQGTLAH